MHFRNAKWALSNLPKTVLRPRVERECSRLHGWLVNDCGTSHSTAPLMIIGIETCIANTWWSFSHALTVSRSLSCQWTARHTVSYCCCRRMTECPTICRSIGACASPANLSVRHCISAPAAETGEGRLSGRLDCGVDDDDHDDILNHSLPAWRNNRSRKWRHLGPLHICTWAFRPSFARTHTRTLYIYKSIHVVFFAVRHPHLFADAATAAHRCWSATYQYCSIYDPWHSARSRRIDRLFLVNCSASATWFATAGVHASCVQSVIWLHHCLESQVASSRLNKIQKYIGPTATMVDTIFITQCNSNFKDYTFDV